MTIANLSWHDLAVVLLALVASYLFALPLAWERKAKSRAYVGLRVFPLVAVSSCVYVILGQQLFTGADVDEQSDILQRLMTGIGFVGAGAIVKARGAAYGVATAAAVWTTGAIGASVAYGHYAIAAVLCVMALFILDVMPSLRRFLRGLREPAAGSEEKGDSS